MKAREDNNMYRLIKIVLILALLLFAIPIWAVNVKDYASVHEAYQAAPLYDELYFPIGTYKLDKPLVIDRLVNIRGEGRGSVILVDGIDAIVIDSRVKPSATQYITVKDITICNTQNTGNLLSLYRTADGKFENIGLRGGDKAIYISGSLRNVFRDCYTHTGSWSNRAPLPIYGIYAEADRTTRIGNNANRFYNCNMRWCETGIYITDGVGQGSFSLTDSTVEGSKKIGLHVRGILHGVGINNCHFEANNQGILLEGITAGNIQVIYSSDLIEMKHCTQVTIQNSYISGIRCKAEDGNYNNLFNGIFFGKLGLDIDPSAGQVTNVRDNAGGLRFPVAFGISANLIDGDLEVWDKGVPIGFKKYNVGEIIESDIAQTGQKSALIRSSGKNIGISYLIAGKQFAELAGKKIALSAYARSDKEANAAIFIRYRGGTDYFSVKKFRVGNEWQRITIGHIINDKASEINIIFGLYNEAAGMEIYMDNIEIRRGDTVGY